MRADEAALVALRAEVHVHPRHIDRDAPLLELARAKGHPAARLEGAHGKVVAVEVVARLLDGVGEVRRLREPLRRIDLGRASIPSGVRPGGGDLALHDALAAHVDPVDVHLHHLVPLLPVHLLDRPLEQLDGRLERHDAAELEEDALHDHVDALAQARLHANLGRVDQVQFCALLRKVRAHLRWQSVGQLRLLPCAIDDADSTLLQVPRHIVLLRIALLVDGQVVRRAHIIRGVDRLGPEAEVADGHATALLCVVLEVCLSVQVGVHGDQLHSALVCAHCAVASESVEHALRRARREHIQPAPHGEGEVCDVIVDAHSEASLGRLLHQVLEDGHDHVRRELLRPEAVAAPDNDDRVLRGHMQRRRDLRQERLAL
mmetsp:Transcript_29156/g.83685  ORF Transcript_29156/g.83685 Transcript_29156/m.83685 type:complete len:374 (-) Transcript_29156:279-1400(-)